MPHTNVERLESGCLAGQAILLSGLHLRADR